MNSSEFKRWMASGELEKIEGQYGESLKTSFGRTAGLAYSRMGKSTTTRWFDQVAFTGIDVAKRLGDYTGMVRVWFDGTEMRVVDIGSPYNPRCRALIDAVVSLILH